MASARPSAFKQGGGFLNNVDAVITGYEFTTEFPNSNGKSRKKSDFTPLYSLLSVRVDGADEDEQTTLFVGDADAFEVTEEGHTLEPVDESIGLRGNADWSKLVDSLCKAGFPESNLPEDRINYESIIGTRVRLKQEVDEDATKRLGKKKDKKSGKEYNRTYLVVSQVYALPGQGGDGKATSSKVPGKAAKGPNVNDLAKETLMAILEDNGGKIAKAKLPVQIAKKLGSKHPQREEVRKVIYSDDFLETEDGWTFDASSKNQMIEAAD